MALNLWSKRSLVIFAAICAAGGFLVGSSSSQEAKRDARDREVGRYQMMSAIAQDLKIFDTKTGQYWQRAVSEGKYRWEEHAGPFDADKQQLARQQSMLPLLLEIVSLSDTVSRIPAAVPNP